MPDGCRITAEVCTDSGTKEVAVENWPGHTTTVTRECWTSKKTVSCPSYEKASSCQKLMAAGCQKTSDPVCETTENGTCTRWAVAFKCYGQEIIGDDLVVDEIIDTIHPEASNK